MATNTQNNTSSAINAALIDEQNLLSLLAPYTLAPTGTGPLAPENPAINALAEATGTVVAQLVPSNNSGVSGEAILHLDRAAGRVSLDVIASGLTPGQIHPQHIHGFDNDAPSLLPNITLDADRDGFVEDPEGAPVVAPALLSGTASGAVTDVEISTDFPTADANGNLRFHQDYQFNLADPNQAAIFENLEQRLAGREFQIHGLAVAAGEGAGTGNEVDGSAGYKIALPVANGIFLPLAAVEQSVADLSETYRFYNATSQDHFFTNSAAERDQLLLGASGYRYEGVAWETPADGLGTVDVFRFYDTQNGTHFYTASTTERDQLLASAPSFHLEGVAFQAYADPAVAGTGAETVERFYNTGSGAHTFTADPGEIAAIRGGQAGANWVDEGQAFTVHAPLSELHA